MRNQIKQFFLDGKELSLPNRKLQKLPCILSKEDIEDIVDLNIGHNCFYNLPEDMKNIEILDCRYNYIHDIPNYSKLKELYCMGNSITVLPSMVKLEVLNCTDNYIRSIPTMPKLRELRCIDCPIKHIAFQPNLEVLYISMNSIKDLPLLPKLRKIIVHNFNSFMDYHFLEDTTDLRSAVIEHRIKYLAYYIHIIKMQRRFRRNQAKTILNKTILPKDLINNITKYITN